MKQVLSILAMGILVFIGTTTVAMAGDVRLFVHHEVADYAVWKKGYNDYAKTQKKMGVIYQAVYQSIDNPNDVTVIHDFHSAEKAKAFVNSPDLKATMEKLGVKGEPHIWYTTKGKK